MKPPESRADFLRRAAQEIRADFDPWPDHEGLAPAAQNARFHLAVADLLDAEVRVVARLEERGGHPQTRGMEIARAYLGEDPTHD